MTTPLIPSIIKEYIRLFDIYWCIDGTRYEKFLKNNTAHILMRTYDNTVYYEEYFIEGERENIHTVFICDDQSYGMNNIIGDVLICKFPNVKTVIINAYRYYNAIFNCDELYIDNLIIINNDGIDDVFENVKKIPNLKHLLCSSSHAYSQQKDFKFEFEKCLLLNVKLESCIFKAYVEYDVAQIPPNGWTLREINCSCAILQSNPPRKYTKHDMKWIIYEKILES
jgi:hypothetical protein